MSLPVCPSTRRGLARSYDGQVIHREDCRYARVPWNWAEDATDGAVLKAKLFAGLRVCKVCKPSLRREVSP